MSGLPLVEVANESTFRGVILCPNCWHKFPLESVLWIAGHPQLKGDPQLPTGLTGTQEQKRVIAERFSPDGRAIDELGSFCSQLACPRCHLLIPRACTELPTITLSLIGAPGSGKSVFLPSMTFAMRQQADQLGLRFQDADLTLNKLLSDDERELFLGGSGYRDVDRVIAKTQLTDERRYRISKIEGHECRYVPPFTFILGPSSEHPRATDGNALSRLLCLYDNAGEHFLPGADTATTPMTRHLAASQGLIFTFDPTKDPRIRARMSKTAAAGNSAGRQDDVLVEAANRIREHAGISSTNPVQQPLVVVLTKFDAWYTLLPNFDGGTMLMPYPGGKFNALFADKVNEVSQACEAMLKMYCPEIVSTAKSVSNDVIYCPVAAIGWDVQRNPSSGSTQFRGENCSPYGVIVPLLHLLHKSEPLLCPTLKRKK